MNGTFIYHSNTTLKAVEVMGPNSPVQVFTFTSIISAVDPVAVLAIFSEVSPSSLMFPNAKPRLE